MALKAEDPMEFFAPTLSKYGLQFAGAIHEWLGWADLPSDGAGLHGHTLLCRPVA